MKLKAVPVGCRLLHSFPGWSVGRCRPGTWSGVVESARDHVLAGNWNAPEVALPQLLYRPPADQWWWTSLSRVGEGRG